MNKYLDITKPRFREKIWVGYRKETRDLHLSISVKSRKAGNLANTRYEMYF